MSLAHDTGREALGLTAALAARAAEAEFAQLSPATIRVAKQCLMDWLGVAIAGHDAPLVEILMADAAEDYEGGACSIVARGMKLPPLQAALINGAMGHALDYDDVIFMGHPTAPVAPAVLAMTERLGASGEDLLIAFVAGFDTECRVSRFVGPSHYAKGWHSTATLGTFGAAAGAGRLLRLGQGAFQHAFGLAAAQAAGLKSMFGTMTKPFHAGHAAQAGLHAARLAARGFTSNPDALETEQGFGATQSSSVDIDAALADPPAGQYVPDTLFKYHAACYLTHSSIEAASALRGTFNGDTGQIERVVIQVDPGHLRVCNIQTPATGLECKFSLRMTAAFALSGENTASDDTFSEANAKRPDLVALRDRVEVAPTGKGTHASVDVIFRDGRMASHSVDVGIPMRDLDAQQEKLEAKFRTLVTPVLGAARTERLVDVLKHIEAERDLSVFYASLRGGV